MTLTGFVRSHARTLVAVGTVLALVTFSGCSAPGEQSSDLAENTITFGRSATPYSELFEDGIGPILEANGYHLEGIDFSDLLQADLALNDGEIDVNVEQHTAYMDNFNEAHNGKLVAISPIPTVPAGIFSQTHSSIDEIADGQTVAVPNDASNTSRGYRLLAQAGWITMDPSADDSSYTQADIASNPYNLTFQELDSSLIPRSLDDFDFAVIPGSIVYASGLDPASSLFSEDVAEFLQLQVVVTEENADADWAQAIVDAYHSDEFKTYLNDHNDGLWFVPELSLIHI